MTVNTEEQSLHDKENENDTAEMFATNNTLMEVSTMMQSPLRSSLQVTTEEEEVTTKFLAPPIEPTDPWKEHNRCEKVHPEGEATHHQHHHHRHDKDE